MNPTDIKQWSQRTRGDVLNLQKSLESSDGLVMARALVIDVLGNLDELDKLLGEGA